MELLKIEKIGSSILEKFDDNDFSEASTLNAFKKIAFENVGQLEIDPEALLLEISNGENKTKQYAPEHNFSDGRFTLFNSKHFIIELNVWSNGFTDAHEHGFTGVFKLIKGAAFNAIYTFQDAPEQRYAPQIVEGVLGLKEVIKIEKNEPQIIDHGRSYIHKIVHTQAPTMTLIIRTKSGLSKKGYQYNYLSEIAYLPNYYSEQLHQSCQIAAFNSQLSQDDYWTSCKLAIEHLSTIELFYFFKEQFNKDYFGPIHSMFLEHSVAIHGEDFTQNVLEVIFHDFDKDACLGTLRNFANDVDVRIILCAYILHNSLNEAIPILPERLVDELPQDSIDIEMWGLSMINDELSVFEEMLPEIRKYLSIKPKLDNVLFDCLKYYSELDKSKEAA